jgi:putative aldouronate transport system permease protein
LAKQVSSQKRTQGSSGFFRTLFQQRELALMVIPGIIIVFIFNYIPIYGIVIAFQNYNPVAGFFGSDWVGLKYFTQFFHDPFLGRLLRNTLLLGIYSLLWSFPAPIILALLLDQISVPWYKKTVQSISYLPYFISAVVIIGIVKNFCGIDGVFNQARMLFGADAVSFLTEPKYFRTIFIASGIWQNLGWGSIIYLAALSNVDPQLHEAATIDGANRWQRIRYITWPAIVPTTSIMLIFAVSGILGSDAQKVLLLYSESTYETADIIGTYVYRLGILGGKFEYTTAIGLLTSLVALVLLCIANFASRRLSENSLW